METKKLNMPKTDFTQRSEHKTKEPELLKLWENTLNERNKLNQKRFLLHDGPPYANGELHVGHVLNKVLKDMVVKWKLMNGYKVDFRPGWDCHGLPTELAVQKKFKEKLSHSDLRKECHKLANGFVEKQMETFKSLGVFADWENKYQTNKKEFEVKQLELLYFLMNKGLVYLDNRPVHYSPSTRTVLAESELEYQDRTDVSAYFTFDLEDGRKLVAWTTQPWTLLGNKAVCVNPNLTYKEVVKENQTYVVGEFSDVVEGETSREFKGNELEGLNYVNKLTGEKGVVLLDDFVKSDSGTGLVHLCPAHGDEDFEVCKRNNLEGEDLTDNSGKVNGKFCLDYSNDVVEEMNQLGMLVRSEEYKHSYPHDWRTKKPVYYRLTEQFFLNLKELNESALESLEEVDMSEERWKNRLTNMLKGRDKWCLSRQRQWGFPFAVFLKDGKPVLDKEVYQHLYGLFEESGCDVWFELTDDELLPVKWRGKGLEKCNYTLDVWFDSGSSWLSVMNGEVSDMYLEGSDQFRGWYQSSLLTSVAMKGRAPYKKVLTHGFVMDQQGRKMSKSLGNVVDPKDVQEKTNTDVLRLWVAQTSYGNDVTLGDAVLNTCSSSYFKLRNTMKYFLGNMYGFEEGYEPRLSERDRKCLDMNQEMYENCMKYYDDYDFKFVLREVMKWVSEVSSFYLDDVTKSFLYEYELDSNERMDCQYVLKDCAEKMMKVLAPMTPFLAEDAYQHYEFKKFDSVFMESF